MKTNRIYEYNGKHYCDKDLSETDPLYAGDLYSLYFDAAHGDLNGALCEETVYYSAYNPECIFETVEELVEDFFSDDVIGEVTE